jgi:hypothetical protein
VATESGREMAVATSDSAGPPSIPAAALKTPPFPENGPGLRPEFDGVELLLMDHATPPDKLLANMASLGMETVVKGADSAGQLSWPEMTPELAEVLSVESITTWDFPLIKLNEVRCARTRVALFLTVDDAAPGRACLRSAPTLRALLGWTVFVGTRGVAQHPARQPIFYRGALMPGHDVALLHECKRVHCEDEESSGVHHSAPSQLFTQIISKGTPNT